MNANIRPLSKMLTGHIITGVFFISTDLSGYAREEIRLWKGKAPGSETWTHEEVAVPSADGIAMIRDVVDPSMTVYLPDPSRSNGIAVVVCPGGAFRALAWESEGVAVARWLNENGIAAFVLKYRLFKPGNQGDNQGRPPLPRQGFGPNLPIKNANANPAPDNEELNDVIRMAIADGQQAIRLVRQDARKWNIDPSKIGIMGFSAGGGVVVGTALLDDPAGYPDFLATLYGPSQFDVHVPANAPPLFIAVAANHKPVSLGCVALYEVWNEAGRPVELHVFSKGNAGFGMGGRGLPSDSWPDLFLKWLKAEGF
ncbi:MAG TPA: alpha/beta hydrolase [Acidobacteriota bacterium]|nr:alpha/beta hydrolase [Acidobacteriota bacterium]